MYNFLKNIFGINDAPDEEIGSFDEEIGSFDDEETASTDEHRVSWRPAMVRSGDTIHINYQGLLKDANAQDIYLHYGFDSWSKGPQTAKMAKEDHDSYGIDIQVNGDHEINFCFKDGANHWDNNDGFNWNIPLQ